MNEGTNKAKTEEEIAAEIEEANEEILRNAEPPEAKVVKHVLPDEKEETCSACNGNKKVWDDHDQSFRPCSFCTDPENQEQEESPTQPTSQGHEKADEKEEEDREQEKVGEDDKVPPLPARESLEEMKNENDGSLGQALLNCLGREGEMSDTQFKVFEDAYDRALNKAPCPCGLTRPSLEKDDTVVPVNFAECCKPPWKMMRRSYEKEAVRQRRAKKQVKKQIEKMNQVKPIITVGVKPDGSINLDKPKGAPENIALADLVDVLQKAWAQAYMHMTIRAAKEIIKRELASGEKGKGPLPGM